MPCDIPSRVNSSLYQTLIGTTRQAIRELVPVA